MTTFDLVEAHVHPFSVVASCFCLIRLRRPIGCKDLMRGELKIFSELTIVGSIKEIFVAIFSAKLWFW